MSDNRVMTAEARSAEARTQRTAELIGDGANLDAATFAGLGLGERMHLFKTNPDRYRELQTELARATDLARLGGGR